MDSISDYVSQKDEIISLKKQLASAVAMKHKAIKAKEKAIDKTQRLVDTVVKMQIIGLVAASDQQLAGICFVTEKTIIEARYRLKKLRRQYEGTDMLAAIKAMNKKPVNVKQSKFSTLSVARRKEIGDAAKSEPNTTIRALAKRFGVGVDTIKRLRGLESYETKVREDIHGFSKRMDSFVTEIKKETQSVDSVAKKLGIPRSTAHRIKRRILSDRPDTIEIIQVDKKSQLIKYIGE